jgi:hypothetical protein
VLNRQSLILLPEASLNFALEFCVLFNTGSTEDHFTNFLVRKAAQIKMKQHANEMNENMTQVKHEFREVDGKAQCTDHLLLDAPREK